MFSQDQNQKIFREILMKVRIFFSLDAKRKKVLSLYLKTQFGNFLQITF
jgi:hypothetical protein